MSSETVKDLKNCIVPRRISLARSISQRINTIGMAAERRKIVIMWKITKKDGSTVDIERDNALVIYINELNNEADLDEITKIERNEDTINVVLNVHIDVEKNQYNKAIKDLKNEVTEDIKTRIKSWKTTWSRENYELMDYAATTCLESLSRFAAQLKAGES